MQLTKVLLDCTIRARTVTVVHRAAEVENYVTGRRLTHGTLKKNNDVRAWSKRSTAGVTLHFTAQTQLCLT